MVFHPELIAHVDSLNDGTIIATGPLQREDGGVSRVVLREQSGQYVTHTQCVEIVAGVVTKVFYISGNYFKVRGDGPEVFARAWNNFEDRVRLMLDLPPNRRVRQRRTTT